MDLSTKMVFLCEGQFPPLSFFLGSCAVLQKHWTHCPSALAKALCGQGLCSSSCPEMQDTLFPQQGSAVLIQLSQAKGCFSVIVLCSMGVWTAQGLWNTLDELPATLTILHLISYLFFFPFLTTLNNFITIQAHCPRKFRHLLGYTITTLTKVGPPLR